MRKSNQISRELLNIDTDTLSPDGEIRYTKTQVKILRKIYLAASVGWVFLVNKYKMISGTGDKVEVALLFIPIVVFTISYIYMETVSRAVEAYMFKANLLTIGLIVALPLLKWVRNTSSVSKGMFTKLVSTGVIFSMLGLIDIWIPHTKLCYMKHLKSILQTTAI